MFKFRIFPFYHNGSQQAHNRVMLYFVCTLVGESLDVKSIETNNLDN